MPPPKLWFEDVLLLLRRHRHRRLLPADVLRQDRHPGEGGRQLDRKRPRRLVLDDHRGLTGIFRE